MAAKLCSAKALRAACGLVARAFCKGVFQVGKISEQNSELSAREKARILSSKVSESEMGVDSGGSSVITDR